MFLLGGCCNLSEAYSICETCLFSLQVGFLYKNRPSNSSLCYRIIVLWCTFTSGWPDKVFAWPEHGFAPCWNITPLIDQASFSWIFYFISHSTDLPYQITPLPLWCLHSSNIYRAYVLTLSSLAWLYRISCFLKLSLYNNSSSPLTQLFVPLLWSSSTFVNILLVMRCLEKHWGLSFPCFMEFYF